MNHIDEEAIGRLIRETYRPMSMPLDVKEQIRKRLLAEIESYPKRSIQPWERPRLVVPVLASIASGLIAYGCWVSVNLA
jgi:hypothetical protein